MSENLNPTCVEAGVSAALLGKGQAAGLRLQRCDTGFTLAELVVSVGVLVLLVFLTSQLLKSAATVTTLGHKQMDADSQARQVLDRMAVDFAQMVKRSDVDYYVKSSWLASGTPPPPLGVTGLRTVLQPGNDQIAFYSLVPGYYPTTGSQSPFSLVSYRVYNPSPAPSPCPNCNQLQRMGTGLLWNASTPTSGTPLPSIVFMPIPVASALPAAEYSPSPTPTATPTPAWPQAGNMTPDSAYEVVGPRVLRFEYYYLLKNGLFSDDPMILPHSSLSGMQDVSAIVVDIAVIDDKSKVLLDALDPTSAKLRRLNGSDSQAQGPVLIDWGSTSSPYCSPSPCPTKQQWSTTPGLLAAQWRAAIDGNATPNGIALPLPVISGIRVYERVIYLSPATGL